MPNRKLNGKKTVPKYGEYAEWVIITDALKQKYLSQKLMWFQYEQIGRPINYSAERVRTIFVNTPVKVRKVLWEAIVKWKEKQEPGIIEQATPYIDKASEAWRKLQKLIASGSVEADKIKKDLIAVGVAISHTDKKGKVTHVDPLSKKGDKLVTKSTAYLETRRKSKNGMK